MKDEEPPKDAIEAAIDVFCVAAGLGLIFYLKAHYASDLGDWVLSLFS